MKEIEHRSEPPVSDLARFWRVMTFYERFEQLIAVLLGFVIVGVVVVALWNLVRMVAFDLFVAGLDPLEHATFQTVFGAIMTLLIALEFKHSIVKVVHRRQHIVQVRTVMLIAQIALARKFILLDLKTTDALHIFALASAVVGLAVASWLHGTQQQGSDPAVLHDADDDEER